MEASAGEMGLIEWEECRWWPSGTGREGSYVAGSKWCSYPCVCGPNDGLEVLLPLVGRELPYADVKLGGVWPPTCGNTKSGKVSAGVRNTAPTKIALVLDAGKRRIPCLPPVPEDVDRLMATMATYVSRGSFKPESHDTIDSLTSWPSQRRRDKERNWVWLTAFWSTSLIRSGINVVSGIGGDRCLR